MKRYFPAAPWAASLKTVSLLATLMLAGVGYAAFRAVPYAGGFTHNFGLGVALIPPGIGLGAIFFIVRGYAVDAHELAVARLVTTTRIPLAGLQRVWADPGVCKGARRIAGNGGMFSFTGWFENERLGRFRLFVTDFDKGVVLRFSDKTIVISPASPQAFIEHLRRLAPGVQVGQESGQR